MDEGEDTNRNARKSVEPVEEEGNEVARAARRLWEQAADAMERMRDRLCGLEVTKATAHRIWGPATFVFLGVLHVARAIRRRKTLRESVPSATSLVRAWLVMLLADRDQGDDYASTPRSTYEGRVFPSLAWDLSNRFDEAPQLDVFEIICVSFAHVLAYSRTDKRLTVPVVQWLILRDLAGDLAGEAFHSQVHLKHLWSSYFQDDGEPITWEAVQAALGEMQRMTWREHPGVNDLMVLDRLKGVGGGGETGDLSEILQRRLAVHRSGGFRSMEVGRFDESCGNVRCARYGIETVEMRALRDLRPVICPTCGYLLVPDLLAKALGRLNDG